MQAEQTKMAPEIFATLQHLLDSAHSHSGDSGPIILSNHNYDPALVSDLKVVLADHMYRKTLAESPIFANDYVKFLIDEGFQLVTTMILTGSSFSKQEHRVGMVLVKFRPN